MQNGFCDIKYNYNCSAAMSKLFYSVILNNQDLSVEYLAYIQINFIFGNFNFYTL